MLVTHYFHSGSLVELDQHLLLFDYYQGELQLNQDKPLYVFVSHRHFDHYNPDIFKIHHPHITYILSDTLRHKYEANYVDVHQEYIFDDIKVKTLLSTDEGCAFLVEVENQTIYFAGDLNWWHWDGDTETNNKFARNRFAKEMKHLTGLVSDVAFFPIDSRLGEYCALGVKEFCDHTMVRQLIAMHTQGIAWHPPEGFFAKEKEMKYWCPTKNGSKLSIEKGELSCKENG